MNVGFDSSGAPFVGSTAVALPGSDESESGAESESPGKLEGTVSFMQEALRGEPRRKDVKEGEERTKTIILLR